MYKGQCQVGFRFNVLNIDIERFGRGVEFLYHKVGVDAKVLSENLAGNESVMKTYL